MDIRYEVGQKVEVTIDRLTPLGYVVSFNGNEGLAYNDEVYEELELGKKYIGYIKTVRKDGKIDITFRRVGYRNFIESATDIVMRKLKDNNGRLELSDKSSPEFIRAELGMSKKQFKQAIGRLFKERKIVIEEEFITNKVNSKNHV